MTPGLPGWFTVACLRTLAYTGNVNVKRARRLCLLCSLVVGAGIVPVPSTANAQVFEYVITFDDVVVRGVDPVDTPEVVHRELPVLQGLDREAPLPKGTEGTKRTERIAGQPQKATEASVDRSSVDRPKEGERATQPLPRLSIRLPGSLPGSMVLPSEPGLGRSNPSFVQEGFLVEAFWAGRIGTPEGFFKRAHFHPPDLSTGFEAQHLGNPDELHGLYIRSVDGKRFGLKSLRYRVTRNRQLPGMPLSLEGFSNYNVNVLVARSFDPRSSIRGQFVPFFVGLPVGNETNLPWWTLRISGFQLLEQLYIASSASVDFDDIVLTRNEPPAQPR